MNRNRVIAILAVVVVGYFVVMHTSYGASIKKNIPALNSVHVPGLSHPAGNSSTSGRGGDGGTPAHGWSGDGGSSGPDRP